MAKSYGGVRNSGTLVRTNEDTRVYGGTSEIITIESSGQTQRELNPHIMGIVNDIETQGFSRQQQPFSIGKVDSDLKLYAAAQGIELGSDELYMSARQIAHTLRDLHKEKGISISSDKLASFPLLRHTMSLYHDKSDNNFVYFDGSVKYVVHPNYSLKLPTGKKRVVNFITAYTSNGTEFKKGNFVRIR